LFNYKNTLTKRDKMSVPIIIMASTTMLLAGYIGIVIFRIKNNNLTTSKYVNLAFSFALIAYKSFLQIGKGFELLSAIGQSIGFVYIFIIPALVVVFLMNKFKFNMDEFMSAWLFTQICCLFVISSH
tara:strand:+ start:269 stop:649 length:381 start_codon:yes stop_codon:yes gene_type:complete